MQSNISQQKQTSLTSVINLIQSEQLTTDMLLTYIRQYISYQQVSRSIINKLNKLEDFQLASLIPILVTIQASVKSSCLQNQFLTKTAFKSIPLYLLIRWSYTTSYEPESEERQIVRNKLDAKFINFVSTRQLQTENMSELSPEQIHGIITKKQVLSNYINVLNKYFQKLFLIPEKLANFQQKQRKQQLDRNLNKLFQKFKACQQIQYCTGICFPFIGQDIFISQSYLIVRFVNQLCFPFTTKQHIPFKIVFETLNFSDYDQFSRKQQILSPKQIMSQSRKSQKSLLLPHTYFGAEWEQIKARVRNQSPYGAFASYHLHAYIVKTGDDMRQQYFAMQLMNIIHKIFVEEHLKLWVKPYTIIPFNRESGLIQFIHDTKTISSLKAYSGQKSLRLIYKQVFGDNWETAITNFTHSLAGYSIYQYLFQVKDRHNNNILVDKFGHIVHIDFSFMISNSPGNLNFEKAPFKLTQDYIQLMQGTQSDIFNHFKFLLFVGLKILKKYKKQIMSHIDIMKQIPEMKCFVNYDAQKMIKRFHEHATDQQLNKIVQTMVDQSYRSYSTSNYDRYQWYTNTIHT